jgi:hypothetical protein
MTDKNKKTTNVVIISVVIPNKKAIRIAVDIIKPVLLICLEKRFNNKKIINGTGKI